MRPRQYRRISIKHPTIIDEKIGNVRSMTWTEWIELVIKPQIEKNKNKENDYET